MFEMEDELYRDNVDVPTEMLWGVVRAAEGRRDVTQRIIADFQEPERRAQRRYLLEELEEAELALTDALDELRAFTRC